MAQFSRFNHLRNRTLFISLTALSAFTAGCGSDAEPVFSRSPSTSVDTDEPDAAAPAPTSNPAPTTPKAIVDPPTHPPMPMADGGAPSPATPMGAGGSGPSNPVSADAGSSHPGTTPVAPDAGPPPPAPAPDPVFSHSFGRGTLDMFRDVFTDAKGATFAAGSTTGARYPGMLIAKYDPGGGLAYIRSWETGNGEEATGVVADSLGNAYFVGSTQSATTDQDIVVGKIDKTGKLVFVETLATPGLETANDIAIGPTDEIYVTGHTKTAGGRSDLLLVKLDTAGKIVWTSALGGAGSASGESVAVSADGKSIFLTGTTTSATFDVDLLIARFDSAGNLGWASHWGSPSDDEYRSHVAVGQDGNAYIAVTTHADAVSMNDVGIVSYDLKGQLRFQRAVTHLGTGDIHDSSSDVVVDAQMGVFVLSSHLELPSNDTKNVLYELRADGTLDSARVSDSTATHTGLYAMAVGPRGQLAFGGSSTSVSMSPWNALTRGTDYVVNDPVGITEGDAGLTMSRPALTAAPVTGTLGTPAGTFDAPRTSTQCALLTTYNP